MKTWIQQWFFAGLIGLSTAQCVVAEERVWEEGILVLADSPVFDGFLFEHDTQVLTVYFCSGEIAEYRDVSCQAYQALMNAEDRVTWFSKKVHRAYSRRRIASDFRPSHKRTKPHNTQEDHHAIRQSSHSRR